MKERLLQVGERGISGGDDHLARCYVLAMFDNAEPHHVHFGWIKEPHKLVGLSLERPDSTQNPRIVGRYDLTPRGGVKQNPKVDRLFCAHCQAHKHWKGFILAASNGALFMIGSACGPAHYGADRFRQARQAYKKIEDREKLRSRGYWLISISRSIESEIDEILSSVSLAEIENATRLLIKASPDMHLRLLSALLAGEPLKAFTMVRGTKGRLEPAQRSIGRLAGSAIVRCDIRKHANALKDALEALRLIPDYHWEEAGPTALLSPVRTVERAIDALLAARKEALKVDEFFHLPNRQRLSEWVKPLHRFLSIEVNGSEAILVSDIRVKSGPVEISSISKVDLSRLRYCEKARATSSVI